MSARAHRLQQSWGVAYWLRCCCSVCAAGFSPDAHLPPPRRLAGLPHTDADACHQHAPSLWFHVALCTALLQWVGACISLQCRCLPMHLLRAPSKHAMCSRRCAYLPEHVEAYPLNDQSRCWSLRRGQRAMRAAANEPTSSFKLYWITSCEARRRRARGTRRCLSGDDEPLLCANTLHGAATHIWVPASTPHLAPVRRPCVPHVRTRADAPPWLGGAVLGRPLRAGTHQERLCLVPADLQELPAGGCGAAGFGVLGLLALCLGLAV